MPFIYDFAIRAGEDFLVASEIWVVTKGPVAIVIVGIIDVLQDGGPGVQIPLAAVDNISSCPAPVSVVIIVGVQAGGGADLPEVVNALGGFGLFLGLAQRR